MKVDQARTKVVRARHEVGVRLLKELFGFTPAKVPFNPQTGKPVGSTMLERLRYRQWRDSTFPERVHRRRRRKIAHESRRRNRT